MKIATYNVNGINGRLPVLLRWIKETKPDVVCMQELKVPQEKFPINGINDVGYNPIWHGQNSWNGAAILARNGNKRTAPGIARRPGRQPQPPDRSPRKQCRDRLPVFSCEVKQNEI